MVVRRAVKLAHIVCAVFTLNRPRGVTRSQIYKFCFLNFNIRKDRGQFNRALQRAEDEDLISCFQKRYRPGTTSRSSDILWSHRSRRHRGRQRRAGARTCKKTVEVRRSRFQRNKKQTSSCFTCNLEKRRREAMGRRKCKKERSRLRCTKVKTIKGLILCRSFTSLSKRKTPRRKPVLRRSSRIRNKREVEKVKLTQIKKSNVRSRREHGGKRKYVKKSENIRKKRKQKDLSKPKKSYTKRARRDVFREALRRPTRTVAHAESWDRINYSRRRSELQNQELMKDSKMVQRILSARHGPSWDHLNKELRRIKSSRSCDVASNQRPTKKRKA